MRVGVIVAARAPVPYLAEALASVSSQEPAPDEVVVVDHASAPPLAGVGGARMISAHDASSPPAAGVAGVRLIRVRDAAGGPAAARAAGLAELGDAELIALADADDVWEPGKLRAQLDALAAHPDAAVCFGRAVVIDAAGRESGERLPELPAGLHRADSLRPVLYQRNPIPAASAVIRRDALEAVGGFEPAAPLPAGSDWDLWLRLAAAGFAFVCEPAARIRYRRHAGGLTADVARLAQAGLAIHERHAGLVDPKTAREARAGDLETLARGQIRKRRYADARKSLSEAATLRRPAPRERLLAIALTVPGARSLLGRRSPY